MNAHHEKHISSKQIPLHFKAFQSPRRLLKTVYHGSESISNIGPKLWDLTPNRLKVIVSLKVFNQAIKIMESLELLLLTV